MRRDSWNLTQILIGLHFLALFLVTGYPETRLALALIPGLVTARPWTVLTYQLVPGSILWFLFAMIVLWIMGRTLEDDWGSPRFLAFWAVSTFGAAGAAILLGQPLAGDVFLSASLLFAYATLYPDVEFQLFLLIPVKVKWLAVFAGGGLVATSFAYGLLGGVVNVVGMSAGYLFFLATRKLPTRRQLGFKLQQHRAAVAIRSESAGAEARNRGWDSRVREAEARARELGRVDEVHLPLLDELDGAVDPSVTVCVPAEFGYVDDDVCRSCSGYAECAARRIRMAATGESPGEESRRDA